MMLEVEASLRVVVNISYQHGYVWNLLRDIHLGGFVRVFFL